MNFESIPLFGAMKTRLNNLSERQAVLAANIANADTPGYEAMDVKTPDFSRMLSHTSGQLAMTTTNKKHMTGVASSTASSQVIKRDSTYERNPNGNNVSIEEEMSKVAENQADYQKVINLYGKTISMFKTAIGKTNG